jgi:cytidylate kinase
VTRRLDPVPALEEAAGMLRRRPAAVVLVDGRSGSGKTTFAAQLARRTGAGLLRLDAVYPGWDGLERGAAAVQGLLAARARGVAAPVHGWDWAADAPGPALRTPLTGALVVEGCGALSHGIARLGDLRVWVELPDAERRVRALERDGDVFAPHWERWARQERALLAREDPRGAADLVVDGRRFPQRGPSARSAHVH